MCRQVLRRRAALSSDDLLLAAWGHLATSHKSMTTGLLREPRLACPRVALSPHVGASVLLTCHHIIPNLHGLASCFSFQGAPPVPQVFAAWRRFGAGSRQCSRARKTQAGVASSQTMRVCISLHSSKAELQSEMTHRLERAWADKADRVQVEVLR